MAESTFNSLAQLNFDNRFVRELPADPERENYRRQVEHACFSYVQPTPVSNPALVAYSREMMRELDIPEALAHGEDFLQVFAGNKLLPGMQPYAMCYGGHQFGHWAGQLGDGRAILLGDVINNKSQRWSLQLKGSGLTPYSRHADGLAVLRSSLREFLCSEAMFHLGVPTTRALSLVTTGEKVLRDILYDGNPQHEPGAVVCRVAPSFTRFGNFQILAAQQSFDTLKKLLDYTIETDFPELGKPSPEVYRLWFEQVCKTTADMIVHWMRVGFVHGVMNTDNMSILGLTIDYGPYGWLEDYDPDWTPNTTDAQGRRYRFGHQPQVAHWNLLQLAEAIYPIFNQTEPLEQALQSYADHFQSGYQRMMANKLGFADSSDDVQRLADELLGLLQTVETDMTLFYRGLGKLDLDQQPLSSEAVREALQNAWYQPGQIGQDYLQQLEQWLKTYQQLLSMQTIPDTQRQQLMNSVNPQYVLRNYLAQQAIDKVVEGDNSLLHQLHEVLRKPYDEQPGMDDFAAKRPEWARHKPGCSMLSCSS